MRITTLGYFDRSNASMARLGERADSLQTQISTGKKLTSAAQDSVGWQQLSGIRKAAADDATAGANLSRAQALLGQTDGVLGGVETQLGRVRELAIQANSGTLPAEARAAIATEIDGIAADLLALANTKDANGYPLFGGTGLGDAFSRDVDGRIVYSGGGAPVAMPVGNGNSVLATEHGERVFGGADAPAGTIDVFATLAALSEAVRDGEGVGELGDAVAEAATQVTHARSSAGARAARLDLEVGRLGETVITREELRSSIEDTDVTVAITELQKTLTVLQATQSSFSKLSALSLFDYLR